LIIEKDLAALDPPHDHMVHRAGGVYAGLTGHGDGNSNSGKNWQLINQWMSLLSSFVIRQARTVGI
jgi:hypothetical protein